ncbi:hypothetical protein WPS_10760 [Vulcanimicrobium alpinum]|uniref:PEGA domain-containing protein n=1 Tax=Vulcanimicrobium alpinum TaxID=3016050 RepID=A0AAN1XVK7_UNVUL|nr:PEGA domain-containing protein [Vulcanimicrobium alpinum]BDE05800.1 hypothetical protein WPS_10760 [Vulcanimicrobium alpinum]
MLRRLAALAVCVVFLAAVPTGSIYVTTLPSGADVWVDGTYIGRSPLVLDALPAGRHTVGLAKPGWNAEQLDVSVVTGQTASSSTRLLRDKRSSGAGDGTIALHGMPYEAVWLDGAAANPGRDGTFSAPAGGHALIVRTAKGKITRLVTVWPQTRTDVVVQPDAAPVRPSIVAPADEYLPPSAVQVDGEKIVIRFGGHDLVGHLGSTTYRLDGRSAEYDAAPTLIGNRLYLPLVLLTEVSSSSSR